MSERRRDALAILGLAVLPIVYFRQVLSGRVLVPWDVLHHYPPWQPEVTMNNGLLSDPVLLYAPWRTLLHTALASGRLPTWNPFVFGGTPFLANPQAAVLYPPNLLYAFLPVDVATTVLVIGHVWLAASGIYLLARYGGLKVGRIPALVAAVGFAFCGFAMVWAEFPTFDAVFAWLPLMLLALLRANARPGPRPVAALAATVAMAALGGHSQVFIYCGLALGLAQVILLVHRLRGPLAAATRSTSAGVLGLVLGLALAAPQLLPTLEAGGLIVRGREPLAGLVASAFPSRLLPLLALPGAFGDSRVGTFAGPANENEFVAFCGVLCLLLAPLAAVSIRRQEVQVLLAIDALAWAIALGSPVFALLYRTVPSLNQVRGIGRATSLHMFVLPLLAAVGLETLLRWGRTPSRHGWVLFWGIGATATLVLLVFLDRQLAAHRFDRPYMIHQYLAILVPAIFVVPVAAATLLRVDAARRLAPLVPALLFAELFLAYGNYNTADPGPSPFDRPNAVTGFLQAHPGRFVAFRMPELASDTPVALSLSTIGGSDTFILRDFADYFNQVENHTGDLYLNVAPPLRDPANLASPLLANLGVRWVVTQENLSLPGGRPPVFKAGLDRVYALPLPDDGAAQYLLRALDCVDQAGDEKAVMTKVAAATDLLHRGVTADHVPGEVQCAATGEGSANSRVAASVSEIQVGADGRIEATTRSAQPAVVQYAEVAYPGWGVEVDGHSASLLRVDHALMGVAIPAGTHHLVFSFRPRYFATGLIVAAAAAAGLVFAGAIAWTRRRRRGSV